MVLSILSNDWKESLMSAPEICLTGPIDMVIDGDGDLDLIVGASGEFDDEIVDIGELDDTITLTGRLALCE